MYVFLGIEQKECAVFLHTDKVTETTADDIANLVYDISNMPTEYFEAKPERTVYFTEVATSVIPDNSFSELKQKLSDMGVSYLEYKNGDENDRLEKLNSIEDVRFSLNIDSDEEINYNKEKGDEENGEERRSRQNRRGNSGRGTENSIYHNKIYRDLSQHSYFRGKNF